MSVRHFQVAIIGAGPAGLMAAITAAERGRQCVLIEKNRKVGVKILISGGSRCNLTHDTDARGIIEAFGTNGRFLHSALSQFSPADVLDFFHGEGVATKREPNGKIFPASDKALDVQQAMLKRLNQSGCELANQCSVTSIAKMENGFEIQTDQGTFTSESLILATGGLSYAGCGTTGDGYAWLENLGHSITPRFPALVPVCIRESWLKDLSGISLVDSMVSVIPWTDLAKATDLHGLSSALKKKSLMQRRAPLLITHKGLSGPAAMDVSRWIASCPEPESLAVVLDLLPTCDLPALETLLKDAIQHQGARRLGRWLLHGPLMELDIADRLLQAALKAEEVSYDTKLAELSRAEQAAAIRAIKYLMVTPTGTLGYPKAEVTMGGVTLKEVNPKTLESKIIPGLFLAGEILNLDGRIGGFNFQAAFSTGFVAGSHA